MTDELMQLESTKYTRALGIIPLDSGRLGIVSLASTARSILAVLHPEEITAELLASLIPLRPPSRSELVQPMLDLLGDEVEVRL